MVREPANDNYEVVPVVKKDVPSKKRSKGQSKENVRDNDVK